ncbi:MAG: hypothetical protein P4M11_09155 [Candidatus Pacebacteria bacterium]|nr:hypothetical protein [Candidatus Paceibacterota bacterium]
MPLEIRCDDPQIIFGYDFKSPFQMRFYMSLWLIYLVTEVFFVFRFVRSCLRGEEVYRGVYIVLLYCTICLLFLARIIYYPANETNFDYYGTSMYRFLGFIPSILHDVSFLIFALGLQEGLILGKRCDLSSHSSVLNNYVKVKKATLIFLGFYCVGYLGSFAIDVIRQDELGKDVYFIYRIVATVLVVPIVLWSSVKTMQSLKRQKRSYFQTWAIHVMLGGSVIYHVILKLLTSILYLTNVLVTLKCDSFNDDSDWYYIGYLTVYHFFNEYVPCVVMIVLLTFHEAENAKLREDITSQSIVSLLKQARAREGKREPQPQPTVSTDYRALSSLISLN